MSFLAKDLVQTSSKIRQVKKTILRNC